MMYRLSIPFASVVAMFCITTSPVHGAPASLMDCAKVTGGIDQIVCSDEKLATLDRKLVDVYAQASKAATTPAQKNRLAADQQRWLETANRCTGAKDRNECARDTYLHRIADLQAQFKLVAARGPFNMVCNDKPSNVLSAQFFETDPPTARFTYDERAVTAFIARSGSGSRYEGPNVSYWEHQGEASVVWFGQTMKCRTR